MKLIITGIGTDVGKTVVAAILSEALKATYWKPIQCGFEPTSDSEFITEMCSEKVTVLTERFKLKTPASPHFAASEEGVEINLIDFDLPKVEGSLIVEGAGGLFVPINDKGDVLLDVIQRFNLPVVLVISFYLGSINHTLMSLALLKARNIEVFGLISSGDEVESSKKAIEKAGGKFLFNIPKAAKMDASFIQAQAKLLESKLAYL
jgi:dethiobiotin synthetase